MIFGELKKISCVFLCYWFEKYEIFLTFWLSWIFFY